MHQPEYFHLATPVRRTGALTFFLTHCVCGLAAAGIKAYVLDDYNTFLGRSGTFTIDAVIVLTITAGFSLLMHFVLLFSKRWREHLPVIDRISLLLWAVLASQALMFWAFRYGRFDAVGGFGTLSILLFGLLSCISLRPRRDSLA